MKNTPENKPKIGAPQGAEERTMPEGEETHNKKECPNCFFVLGAEENTCPNCGHDTSLPIGRTERERSAKRFGIIKKAVQVGMVLVMLAAALLGRYLGNWWWALLGFGLGLIATFIVFFIMGLAEWYTQVRPYQNEREENSDGSDQGDSGAD